MIEGAAAGRARRFTEADLRLYPTIIRYDGAYATLFKCCRKRVSDYPHLSAWLRDVYQLRTQGPSQLQVRACACMQLCWVQACARVPVVPR